MKPIHIIGGGLAGLALGIYLRRDGVEVSVNEAGAYPRHRVCGEFISGRGLDVMRELDLDAPLAATHSCLIEDAAFFIGERPCGLRLLPEPALSVSRFHLDAALAERFTALGGMLATGKRETATSADGVVLATGRRVEATDAAGWKWFGLKAHARDVPLAAGLEMHLDENSYVGICRLRGNEVNVCGLFRRRTGDGASVTIDALRGSPGSALFRRLADAAFVPESFCAVAGLSLAPQPVERGVCRIGDSWTMIPPITGNGMSMAFEGARAAAPSLVAYARGDKSWDESVRVINLALTDRFARRLRWASVLHQLLFHSWSRARLLPALYKPFWTQAFHLTRE